MSSDPFIKLLDTLVRPTSDGGSSGGLPELGRVRSTSPLKIDIAGMTLDEDDIYVNTMLSAGYERDMSFNGASGTAEWAGGLKAGDQVMLIPTADKQKYFVLCTVEGGS